MDFTFLYLEIFFILLELAAPLLLSMLLFIVLLGLIVGARANRGNGQIPCTGPL